MGRRRASPTKYTVKGPWETKLSWELITSFALCLFNMTRHTQVIGQLGQRQSEQSPVSQVLGFGDSCSWRSGSWGHAVPCPREGRGATCYIDTGLQRRPASMSPPPRPPMALCPVKLHTLPRGTERGHFTFHSEPLPPFHSLLGHVTTMPHPPHHF